MKSWILAGGFGDKFFSLAEAVWVSQPDSFDSFLNLACRLLAVV